MYTVMILYVQKHMQSSYANQNFPCYLTLFLKRKLISMWVTSGSDVGHIWIAVWVSGSSGSTGVTHFQPWYPLITESMVLMIQARIMSDSTSYAIARDSFTGSRNLVIGFTSLI